MKDRDGQEVADAAGPRRPYHKLMVVVWGTHSSSPELPQRAQEPAAQTLWRLGVTGGGPQG